MKAVYTTINRKNKLYEDLKGRFGEEAVVIVGDKKTPEVWVGEKGYIGVEEQKDLYGKFAEALPLNHYARKNIGYVHALAKEPGCEAIYETDDDTFLSEAGNAELEALKVKSKRVGGAGWVNVYRAYSDSVIWPRGLPLEFVMEHVEIENKNNENQIYDFAIRQFLVNGDPDVDAIYRLTNKDLFKFEKNFQENFHLNSSARCPYNSQNTVHTRVAYPFLYLPSFVSFRMTDIWRSIIAQVYLLTRGEKIVFSPPNSEQERNEHDLSSDLKEELPGYFSNVKILSICEALARNSSDEWSYLIDVYCALIKQGIVGTAEMRPLEAWCEVISPYCSN